MKVNSFPDGVNHCSITFDRLVREKVGMSNLYRIPRTYPQDFASEEVTLYLLSSPRGNFNRKQNNHLRNDVDEEEIRYVSLTVDKICPLSSVSEGLLFGNPVTLSFNVANELDWELFKQNKWTFFSLCKKLAADGLGIIVHSKKLNLHGIQNCPFVKQYYLLLPSPDGCHFLAKVTSSDGRTYLLLKSLAVQEQLLPPLQVSTSESEVPSEISEKVNGMITQVSRR